MLLLLITSLLFSGTKQDLLAPPSTSYNVEEIIAQLNLQFCTIVEIGQSYCSLFLEFRSSPATSDLINDNVAELYLGTCDCATMRSWEMCSVPLRKARPYECTFEEALPMVNSSARVHRRLCDPTMMLAMNEPCDCSKQLAQRTQYPVQGFLTCYRAPMPKSICSTHSVCGVARCAAKNLFGLALVQCDPNCKDRQPFCEDPSEVTSRAPTVQSFWSDWTSAVSNYEGLQIDEAICLEESTHAPAFDCLGPGSYCCPKEKADNCHCEVTTTMAEMKVSRFISSGFNDPVQHNLPRRGFVGKQIDDLANTLFRAKTRLFGPKHLNYSYIMRMQQYPNQKRVIYQMPLKDEIGNVKKDP
ncbi:uncharacterized protein [Halyomorpha halys]|uniref:uncharacterized protein n=1 Tax=Halyomorpha halys TaxID=286706 RepID=UPI0006D50F52|nr:uncharacterized protein LOC106682240 [Halyomorpha halys]